MAMISGAKKRSIVKPGAVSFRRGGTPRGKRPRIFGISDGVTKSGKTFLLSTMPGKTAYLNNDRGMNQVIDECLKSGHIIDEATADTTEIMRAVKAKAKMGSKIAEGVISLSEEVFDQWIRDFDYAMDEDEGNEGEYQSVGIDTGDTVWEILRLARFGKLTQVKPQHYGPVNAEYRSILARCQRSSKNVWIVHKSKAEYVDYINSEGKKESRKTGNLIMAGFEETQYAADVIVRHWKDKSKPGIDRFNAIIQDCGPNVMAEDQTFTGVLCNFPSIAAAVYPEVDIEQWMEV